MCLPQGSLSPIGRTNIDVRFVPTADILVRALLRRGTARAAALPSDRPAKIGHSRNYLPKQGPPLGSGAEPEVMHPAPTRA